VVLSRCLPAVVTLGFRGADPQIIRRPLDRAPAPLDHGDRTKHAVEILAVEFCQQLTEGDALLATVQLGCGSRCRASPPFLTSSWSWPRSIARSQVRQAAVSDAMPGAPRTW